MTYDPHKRDSSWQMFAPGLYLDPTGAGHVFPDEVFAELNRLHPELHWDYKTDYWPFVEQLMKAWQAAGNPGPIKFIKHERPTD